MDLPDAGDLSLEKKRELCERDAPVASEEAIEVLLGTAWPHFGWDDVAAQIIRCIMEYPLVI